MKHKRVRTPSQQSIRRKQRARKRRRKTAKATTTNPLIRLLRGGRG